MSARERTLLIALLVILGLGGGAVLANLWFLTPLREHNETIARLRDEVQQKEMEAAVVIRERNLLDQARARSLPASPDRAAAEYTRYLQPLLTASGLRLDDLHGVPGSELKVGGPVRPGVKKHGHAVLGFQARAKGELPALVKALEGLQRAPIKHRIRTLTVDRVDAGSAGASDSARLNVSLVVEVLLVNRPPARADGLHGVDPRPLLADGLAPLNPAPAAPRLSLASWTLSPAGPLGFRPPDPPTADRLYADVAKKNIFVGALPAPPPPKPVEQKPEEPQLDVTKYVRLVTTNAMTGEAFLSTLAVGFKETKLSSRPRSGYDTFRVWDEKFEKVQVRGKVLRVDQRDVYLQVGEDVFAVHIGQTLADAMRRPLDDEELAALELTGLYDTAWAAEAAREASQARARSANGRRGKGGG